MLDFKSVIKWSENALFYKREIVSFLLAMLYPSRLYSTFNKFSPTLSKIFPPLLTHDFGKKHARKMKVHSIVNCDAFLSTDWVDIFNQKTIASYINILCKNRFSLHILTPLCYQWRRNIFQLGPDFKPLSGQTDMCLKNLSSLIAFLKWFCQNFVRTSPECPYMFLRHW